MNYRGAIALRMLNLHVVGILRYHIKYNGLEDFHYECLINHQTFC